MERNRLQHPLFILSVIVLLCNDFYLKQAYGNAITGKLSDFVGLFAFPFFFSCLFPNWKKHIHILTTILFVWWKSSFSQFFIDGANWAGIPMGRVIDFSDNMALVSILVSYFILKLDIGYKNIKPALLYCITFVSSFAFIATTLPPKSIVQYSSVDKEYHFDIPAKELIMRLNEVQMKEIKKRKNISIYEYDTIAKVLYYKHPDNNIKDTLIYFLNPDSIKDTDTINLRYYMGDIQIFNTANNESVLKLINIANSVKFDKFLEIDSAYINPKERMWKYRYLYDPIRRDAIIPADTTNTNKLQKKAIKEFEKRIIKKIK
jgi:hypothetical protein